MRILLANFQSFIGFPSIGCAYLLSSLEKNGIEVELLDPVSEGFKTDYRNRKEGLTQRFKHKIRKLIDDDPINLIEKYKNLKSKFHGREESLYVDRMKELIRKRIDKDLDCLCFSVYTGNPDVLKLIEYSKSISGLPVIVGGPVFSITGVAEQWMNLPFVDYVMACEGEYALPQLIKNIINKKSNTGLKGIWRKEDGVPRFNGNAGLIEDLNLLPNPDYKLYNIDNYKHAIFGVLTSRGCAWCKCKFCGDITRVSSRGRHRARKAENVLGELENNLTAYDARNYIFLDEMLNGNELIFKQLLEMLIAGNLNLTWSGAFHLGGDVDSKILDSAFKAGMRIMSCGIESGSQRILDLMRKGTNVENNHRVIRRASSAGFNVRCGIIYGCPGEGVEELQDTVKFLSENSKYLSKVTVNQFSLELGSYFGNRIEDLEKSGLISEVSYNPFDPYYEYEHTMLKNKDYMKLIGELQSVARGINNRGFTGEAVIFEGLI